MKIIGYYIDIFDIKTTHFSAKANFLLWLIIGCCNQISIAQQTRSALVNLGPNINSVYEEENPILSPDGNILYFCRGRHPENIGGRKDKGDIWFSVKDENGSWQKAQNIGAPINNSNKNDLAGISADGNKLYLNHTYGPEGKSLKPGLSYSTKTSSEWSVPIKLDIPYFYNASEHQSVFISNDEKLILFSIDSYGSFGAEDLYVSFKLPSGGWSEPMNLGSEINTVHQEITPFLSKDNKTLFFVSNGRKGVGSKDIYKTHRLDTTWKEWSIPENLGPLVNTEGMEMYYFQDNEAIFAYIVSTQNSDGYGDLHRIIIRDQDLPDQIFDENYFPGLLLSGEEFEDTMFQVPDTVIVFNLETDIIIEDIEEDLEGNLIYGKILNTISKAGVKATITVENDTDVKSFTSEDYNGQFKVNIDKPGKFKFIISAKGYMAKEEFIEIQERALEELVFNLIPLEVGTTIQLHDVLFEQGTAKILEISYPELDKVVNMMLENPNLFIELAGHTDNQGVSKLNIKLSQERVENVKKYLIQKGIEVYRISGKGYGGIKPIASNKNEETRKLNRRVEFTIVKN
ncbi:MAG: OmpA family protein [Bacteroidota bacterium]|nr:OmpA family protein [Bacteroidota bacterium]